MNAMERIMILLYFQGEIENKFMQISPLWKLTILTKIFSYVGFAFPSPFEKIEDSGWL